MDSCSSRTCGSGSFHYVLCNNVFPVSHVAPYASTLLVFMSRPHHATWRYRTLATPTGIRVVPTFEWFGESMHYSLRLAIWGTVSLLPVNVKQDCTFRPTMHAGFTPTPVNTVVSAKWWLLVLPASWLVLMASFFSLGFRCLYQSSLENIYSSSLSL